MEFGLTTVSDIGYLALFGIDGNKARIPVRVRFRVKIRVRVQVRVRVRGRGRVRDNGRVRVRVKVRGRIMVGLTVKSVSRASFVRWFRQTRFSSRWSGHEPYMSTHM